MYGKLFEQMYDSSLCENWRALITFQQMVILSDVSGFVDMTHEAIARRTNIPIDIIREGIAELEKPDPRSRSPKESGRRIVRLDEHRDWGWQIVNHKQYRDLASLEEKRQADRVRVAEKRKNDNENKDVATCRTGSLFVADVAHTDTDTDANTDIEKQSPKGDSGGPPPCPQEEIIKLYHELLPELTRVRVWGNNRAKHLRARWREDPRRQNLEWWRKFFTYISKSDFLMGRVPPRPDRTAFLADLEWIIQPRNIGKIIEGKYENKNRAPA